MGLSITATNTRPPVTAVALNGKTLMEGTDYIVSYQNNVNAGSDTATVTVTGKGNYSGTASKYFTIKPMPITITAKPQTIAYGQLIATGIEQVEVSLLATSETLTDITLTASTTDVTDSGTITPSAAILSSTESNYTITYLPGTLTITAPSPGGGTGDSSDSSVSSGSRDVEEYDFWQDVGEKIENAKPGDIVKVNAHGYDKLSYGVMRALRENNDVSLVIRWNGGEEIVIPAGQAQPAESLRIYYPLSLLAELYADAALTDPATGQVVDPGSLNPETGGVWEVTAPAAADTAQSPVTDARRGLAEPPEQATCSSRTSQPMPRPAPAAGTASGSLPQRSWQPPQAVSCSGKSGRQRKSKHSKP